MSEARDAQPNTAFILAKVHARLRAQGWTVATGESLTGGQVVAGLINTPGASRTVRGGIVAYGTDLKARLLGVDPQLLASLGPVAAGVVEAMARGASSALSATIGLATTGVAGPDAQAGAPVGTVHIACFIEPGDRCEVRSFAFVGDRAAIRNQATVAAFELLADCVGGWKS